jgi:serine/threonine-protein kinase
VPPAFAALVDEMMQKAPGARPSAADVVRRLQRELERGQGRGGLAALELANQQAVREKVESDAAAGAAATAKQRRLELRTSGAGLIQRIQAAVLAELREFAPSARVETMPSGWTMTLNGAQFTFRSDNIDSYQLWGGSPGPFDVVEIAEISLRLPRGDRGWEGRSHSLWYCDARNESQFKWYETAFMTMGLVGGSRPVEPFSLPPAGDAAGALSNVMTTIQVAWPFTELLLGELDEFIERWGGWFGQAASNQLSRPSSMPERSPANSWRQRPGSRL